MRVIANTDFFAALGFMACLTGIVSAAELTTGRVFAPPATSSDERLHILHDVDHPWMFEPRYTDKAQWQNRAKELREQILVAEGLWPEPLKTPLNAVIHGKVDRDGYTIEKVFFASMPGHYVSGSLYRPVGKTGKLPVVLCPHGHWTGGRFYENSEKEAQKQVEIGAEKTMEGARFPIQARCAMLARMGCIVFHYDMVGYADSEAIVHRTGFTDVEATLRLQSFMGLQAWNSVRSLDFVCSLPDADVTRIAVTGASGGGTQTLILCAIDDRPAVSFPAVMVSEAMQGGCICENSPLLRIDTNNAEIAACFAPKPLGMTAANDWTREMPYKALPHIREIYKLYGPAATNDVEGWYRSFPHNYNQVSRELMYNWLNKYLKLGQSEPVTEKPFVPATVAELSVYDAEHPRPADSLDAATLRKQMTAASDLQMSELAKSPAEYRKVLSTALHAMVNDKLPSPQDLLVGNSRGTESLDDETIVEKGTLSRRHGISEVPFVSLTPRQWNGTAIVWIHPDGKASLFDADGKVQPRIGKILSGHTAVVAPDLLLTGEHVAAKTASAPVATTYAGFTYPGYHYGYNRAVIAERASDILSTISWVQGWEKTRSIRLIAFGKLGPAALIAQALAGNSIDRSSIDLNQYDFNQIHDASDETMLPGILKYQGIRGLLALTAAQHAEVWNAPESVTHAGLELPNIEVTHTSQTSDEAIHNLLIQLK